MSDGVSFEEAVETIGGGALEGAEKGATWAPFFGIGAVPGVR